MKLQDLRTRIDQIIIDADNVLKTAYSVATWIHVDSEQFTEFRSASLSFIKNVYGITIKSLIKRLIKLKKNVWKMAEEF